MREKIVLFQISNDNRLPMTPLTTIFACTPERLRLAESCARLATHALFPLFIMAVNDTMCKPSFDMCVIDEATLVFGKVNFNSNHLGKH